MGEVSDDLLQQIEYDKQWFACRARQEEESAKYNELLACFERAAEAADVTAAAVMDTYESACDIIEPRNNLARSGVSHGYNIKCNMYACAEYQWVRDAEDLANISIYISIYVYYFIYIYIYMLKCAVKIEAD